MINENKKNTFFERNKLSIIIVIVIVIVLVLLCVMIFYLINNQNNQNNQNTQGVYTSNNQNTQGVYTSNNQNTQGVYTSNNIQKYKNFNIETQKLEGLYINNNCEIKYIIDNKNKKIELTGNYDDDKCQDFRNNLDKSLFDPYNEISNNGSILDNVKQGKKIVIYK